MYVNYAFLEGKDEDIISDSEPIIVTSVGYDNSMYFSRVFKKHTGMTPTEYKRRNINEFLQPG